MSKFCKIIESPKGEQFLILLEQSDESENKCNIVNIFECEGAAVKLTIGGVDWERGEKYLEDYDDLDALIILNDPLKYLSSLTE